MARKGKGKKRARAPSPRSSPPLPAQTVGPVHPPTSEIVITLEHSLELVKTVITATMLEIIWNRRIFPEARWQTYDYDPADPSVTYKSFLEGVEGTDRPNFEPTGGLMLWHFPKRGTTPGLDRLLACLEFGAQDALEKGHLRKLNLSIAFVDDGPITKANLIESYSMTFSYGSGRGISQIYSETTGMQSPMSDPVVLLDAKYGARQLVENVCGLLWNGSNGGKLKNYPLPPYYRMIMAMDYHNGTPPEYQAPLFRNGDENMSCLLDLGHFNENLTMKTGFHSVSVGMLLPVDLEQSMQVHRHLGNEDSGLSQSSRHAQPAVTETTDFRQSSSTRSEIEGDRTQPEAIRQIAAMGASRYPNTETQDTRILHSSSSPVPLISTMRRRSSLSQSRPILPPYTQRIINLLSIHDRVNKHEKVGCGCGASDNTGDLVKCLKCGSFQHVQCQGYLDDTHPMNVMGYWCLLHPEEGPNEVELYEQMQELCVFRRLLHYLLKYGPTADIDELAMHLSRKVEETEKFLTLLQQSGYIQVKRCLDDEEEALIFCTLVEDEEKIRSNYFRPQQKISHYFALPDTSPSAQFHGTVGATSHMDGQSPPPTTQNLSHSQRLTRATRRLLAEASSTQDTSSHRSNSRSSSQACTLAESLGVPQAMTLSLGRSSSSKKRAAESDIGSIPAKRPHPDVVSPWIRRTDGMAQ